MCRWFAYISSREDVLLDDVLVLPDHSISKQVHDHYLPYLVEYENDGNPISTEEEITLRNRFFNADGLGVAWYNKTKESFGVAQREQPTLYKIVRQPLTDPNFVSICENTSSTAVLAHIRAASPGTAITGWNAHPFQFGCHVFMHNGDLAFFDKIKRPLCDEISADAFDVITGTTDSEHLAALMFTYLERLTNVPKAWEGKVAIEDLRISLEQAVAKVIELQVSVSTPDTFQASNVNVCVTDGHQLLAIRFRNHPKEHPPSLYTSVSAGPDLNRKFVGNPDSDGPRPKKFKTILGPHELKPRSEYGPHFVICSEPTTFRKEDWALVPKNTGVIVPPNMKPEWFSIEL